MKITFVLTGSMKRSPLGGGFDEYVRRIGRYFSVEVLEIKDSPMGRKASSRRAGLQKEAARIERRLKGRPGFLVALVEAPGARSFSSGAFARFMGERSESGQDLAFIIGGPYGLEEGVVKKADMALSLSPMTLPHEMAALVLAEQVYRAFTIRKGEPYSH